MKIQLNFFITPFSYVTRPTKWMVLKGSALTKKIQEMTKKIFKGIFSYLPRFSRLKRLSYLTGSVMLALPVVGSVIRIAKKRFFKKTQEVKIEEKINKEAWKAKIFPLLEEPLRIFVDRYLSLTDIQKEKSDCYSQLYEDILSSFNTAEVAFDQLSEYILELVVERLQSLLKERDQNIEPVIIKVKIAFLSAQLKRTNKRETKRRLDVPGDGDCMLWACLVSRDIQDAKKSYKDYENFDPTHADYEKLRQELMQLRAKMRERFLQQIQVDHDFFDYFLLNISQNPSLKDPLLSQICQNPAQKNAIENEIDNAILVLFGNSKIKEEFFKSSPQLTREELKIKSLIEKLIQAYAENLTKMGSWNGNFEIELVAHVLERPILNYMLLKNETENFKKCTGSKKCNFKPSQNTNRWLTYGEPYLVNREKSPLYLEFSEIFEHYMCLV